MSSVLLLVEHARADEVRELHVHLPDCKRAPLDFDELLELLRLELPPHVAVVREVPARTAETGATVVDIMMPCLPEADRITVQIREPARARATRLVELSDLPPRARARGLAVATAELVRSADAAATEGPRSEVSDPPGLRRPATRASATWTEAAPARDALARPPRAAVDGASWDVRAATEARMFLREPTTLFGGMLGGRFERARLGLELLRGDAGDLLGRASVTLAGTTTGFELWRLASATYELTLTPRIGLGVLFAQATAGAEATSKAAREPYVDAALQSEAQLKVSTRWWLTFGIDLGYARGMIAFADDRTVIRPEGPLLGIRLGATFAPKLRQ